jgi:hypothetical protein
VTVACTSVTAQQGATPPANYKKVSALIALPDFVPGLGTLSVGPATLPAGPVLAYDEQGTSSAACMIAVKDITAHKEFNNVAAAKEKVDHVDMYQNAGHPQQAAALKLAAMYTR